MSEQLTSGEKYTLKALGLLAEAIQAIDLAAGYSPELYDQRDKLIALREEIEEAYNAE